MIRTAIICFILGLHIDLQAQTMTEKLEINSAGTEYAPFLSDDGNLLYFQSNRDGYYTVYVSKRSGNSWNEPEKVSEMNSLTKNGMPAGGPSLLADESRLYFSAISGSDSEMDIFYLEKDQEGNWLPPVSLEKPVNSFRIEAFPSLSPGGNEMYFTRGESDCYTIFHSQKTKSGLWKSPEEIMLPPGFTCVKAPRIMPDNHTLIFSAKKDTASDHDLFMIRSDNHGEWSQPEALDFINTPSDETFITVYPDGSKMIFVRDGDLFETEVPVRYRFTTTILLVGNVADKLNKRGIPSQISLKEGRSVTETMSDSLGHFRFVLRENKTYTLFFSSPGYKPDTLVIGQKETDQTRELQREILLEPVFREVVVSVNDAETRKGLKVNIKINNLDTREEITIESEIGKDGKYHVNLREGNRYNIEVSSTEGYAYATTKVEVPVSKVEEMTTVPPGTDLPSRSSEKLEVELEVHPIRQGTELTLKDIFFEFNSTTPDSASFAELERVVKLMKENPSISIEVAAHTDDIGSDRFNQKLSEKRAKAIVDYLNARGIERKRLKPEGYGKTSPVAPNDSEENRARNRRVELKVLDVT